MENLNGWIKEKVFINLTVFVKRDLRFDKFYDWNSWDLFYPFNNNFWSLIIKILTLAGNFFFDLILNKIGKFRTLGTNYL